MRNPAGVERDRAQGTSGGAAWTSDGLGPELTHRLALRPPEAARALGISERTLRSLLPRLPHLRLEGVVLLPVRELQQWLGDQVKARNLERRENVAAVVCEGLSRLRSPNGR